jgi:hypothetical protein
MKVLTTKGLIERAELTVRDLVQEDENVRVVRTEWYLGNELVRASAWVDALRGLEAGVESGN